LGAAQQHLIPELDTAIDLLVEVVAWEQLMLVQPVANPAPLQLVVQAAGEGFVRVVVADKAGVELEGAPD
jgi:hypothetical protein